MDEYLIREDTLRQLANQIKRLTHSTNNLNVEGMAELLGQAQGTLTDIGGNKYLVEAFDPYSQEIIKSSYLNNNGVFYLPSNLDLPSNLVLQGWSVPVDTDGNYLTVENQPILAGAIIAPRDNFVIIDIDVLEENTTVSFNQTPKLSDWGDGIIDNNKSTHTYAAIGKYKIISELSPNFIESIPLSFNFTTGSCKFAAYCPSKCTPRFSTSGLYNIMWGKGRTVLEANCLNDCPNLVNIVIPDGIEIIGNNAFRNCYALKKVVIPKSVTTIGEYAFINCKSLKKLIIPNDVTNIGDGAFAYTDLRNINIPNNVTTIGVGAFSNCESLTNINIPNGITSINNTFRNCVGLTVITIPSSVTSISETAFYGCYNLRVIYNNSTVDLTNVKTQSGIHPLMIVDKNGHTDSTNDYDILDTSDDFRFLIKNNTEHRLISYLGYEDEITLPDYNYAYLIDFSNMRNIKCVNIPNSINYMRITDGAFQNCKNLTTVRIEDGLYTVVIGSQAFDQCSSLIDIIIPECITSIGSQAFRSCTSLQQVIIPDNVSEIGFGAFDGCSGMTKVVVGSGVTSIAGSYGGNFRDCTSMKEYHFRPTTPPTIKENTFSGIPADCIIYVPKGCLSAYQTAQYWSSLANQMQEETI